MNKASVKYSIKATNDMAEFLDSVSERKAQSSTAKIHRMKSMKTLRRSSL